MKRILVIAIIFLAGAGLFAYPSISDYIARKNGSYLIDSYNTTVSAIDPETIDGQRRRAQQYNQSLLGSPVRDPFLEGSGIVMQDDYYEILNINGVMGHIEIPKIGVKLPIFHGTGERALEQGVGHLEGSTLPIGGEGFHTILTGHTGLPHARLFTDLTAMKEGDLFYLQILSETLAYQVDNITVIEPSQTTDLKIVPGKDYCTLFTCTPYMVNSHRLLVRGDRVPYIAEEKERLSKVKPKSSADKMIITAATVTSAVMAVIIAGVVIIMKRKQRHDAKRNTNDGDVK